MRSLRFAWLFSTILLALIALTTRPISAQKARNHAPASQAKHAVDPQSIISDDVKRHLTAVFDPHDTLGEVKNYIAQARGELKTDADKAVLLNIEKAMDAVEAVDDTTKAIAKSKERVSGYEVRRSSLQFRMDNPLPPFRTLLIQKVADKGDISVELDSGVQLGFNLNAYQLVGLRLALYDSKTLPAYQMANLQSWCKDSAKKVAKQRQWSRSDVDAKCRVATSALVQKINQEIDDEYASETRATRAPLQAELDKLANDMTAEKANQAALASKLVDQKAEAVRYFALTKVALGITGSKDPFIDPAESSVSGAN